MKIKYIEKNFRDKSLYLIEKANEIINDYKANGYDLTLRQLYYQFVARDIISNNQKSYDNLGSLINDARLAGLVDWYSIEDRTRNIRNTFHWEDPKYLLSNAAKQFDLNKWKGQEEYIEVWVEKDALVGIVEKAASVYDVPFFSCRGYVSQTEMWHAAQRIIRKLGNYEHKRATIIHLGDHDPSGKDMTRDIKERINMFCSQHGYGNDCFEIQRVALEMEQIYKYNPPPNPAKITDSRCGKYIEQYGNKSWELDALEPSVMENIIISSVLDHLDLRLYREMERKRDQRKACTICKRVLLKISKWRSTMDNAKVLELIDSIEAAIRELAWATGVDHISAFLIDGKFNIDDYTNLENQKFSVFRTEANNE